MASRLSQAKSQVRRIAALAARPTCWLMVFAFVSAGIKSGAGHELQPAAAAERPHEPQPVPEEPSGRRHEGRRCVPILDIVLPQAQFGGRPTTTANLTDGSGTRKLPIRAAPGMPDSFSFAIDEVVVPLSQAASPVQSALRLLSAFDGQLAGLGDELDAELDSNGERPAQKSNVIRFAENQLHISDLNLTMLNLHLYAQSQPKFGLAINIGNATLTGKFHYDGDFASGLLGRYRMSIDNVLVTTSSKLTKIAVATGADELGVGKSEHRLVTNELKINISNLGYISIDILDLEDGTKPTTNYMLKMLQRVLQKTIKRTYNQFEGYIRSTLETEGRRFLDCELTRFSPILSENQAAANASQPLDQLRGGGGGEKGNNLDDLARIISSEIEISHLDKIGMPNFEYQRAVLGTNALIVFRNGSLSGLSNLRLLGDTKLKLQDEHLIANASLGWLSLRTQYNYTLYLGSSVTLAPQLEPRVVGLPEPARLNGSAAVLTPPRPMASGFVAASIKAIEFDTLISRSLRQAQTHVTVDELLIRRLDGPKMDLGGLPGMNRITRATVNFFMGRLKQRLVSSIQPVLRQELERVLNKLAMPV